VCGLVAAVPLSLIAILVPATMGAAVAANRAKCANNLSTLGKALQTYAAGHDQQWPDVFDSDSERWDDVGGTRKDQWGTEPGDDRPPATKPADTRGGIVESNTSGPWMLVVAEYGPPSVVLCPDAADHLCHEATFDYYKVRDFRGDRFCGYSFQNELGAYQTGARSSSQLAVAADANPMRRDYYAKASPGGKTDARMAGKPTWTPNEERPTWRGALEGPWELNSPNHAFRGQNVLYLDGHIEWTDTPYCGIGGDNLWLRRAKDAAADVDPRDLKALRQTNDTASYDGKSTLPADNRVDSFLVP